MGYFTSMKVTALQGIGQARGKAFARLGIETVGDLLYHYPRAYENRGDVRLLSECESGAKQAVILTVSTAPRVALIRRGMSLLKFRAFDDSGVCEIVFFNQDYLKASFSDSSATADDIVSIPIISTEKPSIIRPMPFLFGFFALM